MSKEAILIKATKQFDEACKRVEEAEAELEAAAMTQYRAAAAVKIEKAEKAAAAVKAEKAAKAAKAVTYKIGAVFQYYQTYYILSQVAPKQVALIGLGNASNRNTDAIVVGSVYAVTTAEVQHLGGDGFSYLGSFDEVFTRR